MTRGLAALIALALPASAGAATVRVEGKLAVFTAAHNERNDVRVVRHGPRLAVRDAGAPLRAGRGCTALGHHRARCTARRLRASLRDGDDRFAGGLGRLRCGSGHDVVEPLRRVIPVGCERFEWDLLERSYPAVVRRTGLALLRAPVVELCDSLEDRAGCAVTVTASGSDGRVARVTVPAGVEEADLETIGFPVGSGSIRLRYTSAEADATLAVHLRITG